MRRIVVQLLVALAVSLGTSTLGLAALATITPATESPKRIVEKGLNHRVWERLKSQTLPSGRIITNKESVYELASGMYYNDANGQLAESQELIEIAQGGASAVASHGQHKVTFANNLNTFGAITLQVAGKTLRSHLLGLSYSDPSTGKSILIAGVKDSIGELISPNQNHLSRRIQRSECGRALYVHKVWF